ncbi:MAG: hypothetical protein JWO19_3030 [Bryobacterales bacterium]|nr:hypothetical protein [Bryobacterales bacterium]
MKFFTLSMLVFTLCGFARGDVLRLRNGTEFVGHYIGGTKTEIWFERQGMVNTVEVIPTSLVEGLKFEPGPGSPAGPAGAQAAPPQQARPQQTWLAYLRTVFATAWFPYVSSTRTATVTSPGGRFASAMR